MGTQISLKLSDKMFDAATSFADKKGYMNLQDFIREVIREKLFEDEKLSGLYTALASEKALSKTWLTPEEDAAWEHLQEKK